MPANNDEALRALQSPDWTDGHPDAEAGVPSLVFSVRLKDDLAAWVSAEADRRHVNPSVVIRDAIGTARAAAASDEQITVTRADLHRLIDRLPA